LYISVFCSENNKLNPKSYNNKISILIIGATLTFLTCITAYYNADLIKKFYKENVTQEIKDYTSGTAFTILSFYLFLYCKDKVFSLIKKYIPKYENEDLMFEKNLKIEIKESKMERFNNTEKRKINIENELKEFHTKNNKNKNNNNELFCNIYFNLLINRAYFDYYPEKPIEESINVFFNEEKDKLEESCNILCKIIDTEFEEITNKYLKIKNEEINLFYTINETKKMIFLNIVEYYENLSKE
jgi:hypothetical protein